MFPGATFAADVTQGCVTYYLGNGVLRLYGDAQQKEEGRQQGLHTMFNHLGGLAGRANNEINCEIFLIVKLSKCLIV